MRIGDFASDKLAATLFSYLTLPQVSNGINDGIVVGLVGDLYALLTLFSILSLHLHAINGKCVPPKHGALYLFFSMLFFTSASEIRATSKQNLVNEKIGNHFLILQKMVKKWAFAQVRNQSMHLGMLDCPTKTVADFCLLGKKFAQRMNALFESYLSLRRQ